MMYKIKIENIDKLNELFRQIRMFAYLSKLLNEFKENHLSEDVQNLVRATEYYLIENNFDVVEKLNDLIYSDNFLLKE